MRGECSRCVSYTGGLSSLSEMSTDSTVPVSRDESGFLSVDIPGCSKRRRFEDSSVVEVRKRRGKNVTTGGTEVKKRGHPAKSGDDLKVLELSMTIGIGGEDIDVGLLSCVEKFLREKCMAGLCGVERGGSSFHLHFQMVVRVAATSIIAVNHLVKGYLGWDKKAPVGSLVMCKTLKNKKLHSYRGMIGYCVKDMDEPHFKMDMHNVDAREIQKGIEIYTRYGAGDLKNRISLTPQNAYERSFLYFLFFLRKRITTNLPSCLLSMMKSVIYFPSAAWVTPYQGGGMDLSRACALWNCIKNPSGTTMRDIRRVFFYVPSDPRSPHLDMMLGQGRERDCLESPPQLVGVLEIGAEEFRRAVYQQDQFIPLPLPDTGVHIS